MTDDRIQLESIHLQLTSHFQLAEFMHDGSTEGLSNTILQNLHETASAMEWIRGIFGKPIKITSGFRTPEHNKAVGGAPESQHLYGKAADFVIPGVSLEEIKVKLWNNWKGGLGYYPNKPGRPGWIHFDICYDPMRRRWEG